MPAKLKHLTDDNCRVCGSKTRSFEMNGEHTFGGQNEKRTYTCGAALRYSPNFSREEIVVRCPKDPLRVEEEAALERAKDELRNYIEEIGHTEFKDQIKKELNWTLYRGDFS